MDINTPDSFVNYLKFIEYAFIWFYEYSWSVHTVQSKHANQ